MAGGVTSVLEPQPTDRYLCLYV